MNQNRLKLDEEERSILWDFERGEFESIKNFRAEKQRLEAAASQTLKKGKRVSIRISARDLEKIKKRAVAEGMPYQTLIASTLHKFVTGQLKEAQ
ncbi:MAG: CopG family antitoxin [Desulfurellaceae bacterium]|nr:CopG family antitoxin [Desulfurellaceae bacterium]